MTIETVITVWFQCPGAFWCATSSSYIYIYIRFWVNHCSKSNIQRHRTSREMCLESLITNLRGQNLYLPDVTFNNINDNNNNSNNNNSNNNNLVLLLERIQRSTPPQRSELRENTNNTMMSSNGSIFRITGLLCGKLIGRRWTPLTKANMPSSASCLAIGFILSFKTPLHILRVTETVVILSLRL